MTVDVACDQRCQLRLVSGTVAGRWLAGAAQHAQRELRLQRVARVRELGNIDCLQVGAFDFGVQFGRVVGVAGFQPVGDGAAHRLCIDLDRLPRVALLARVPVAREKQGVGRVQLAFESEDRSLQVG